MDLNVINNQLQYLEETKTQIKTAIIEKGQDISDSDTFRSYVEKINNISTLGKDTADATATANDIVMEKTAYVNGEKITGTLPLFPNSRTFVVDNAGVTDNTEDSTLDLTTINVTKQVLDNNVNMKFSAPYSDITTAIGLTADKLTQGNTILGVEGTATTGGIDTSDADATADDIVSPKTAYVNGEKLEGTIQLAPYQTADELRELGIDPTLFNKDRYKAVVVGGADGTTILGMNIPFVSYVYLKGGYIISALANAELAEDINLSADKIVSGNTILGIEGTASTGGIDTSDADATESDIVAGKTAYVNGEKITGTVTETVATTGIVVGEGESTPYPTYELSMEPANKIDLRMNSDMLFRIGSYISLNDNNELSNVIGLTANKIKAGETILGIEGTYEGSSNIEEVGTIEELPEVSEEGKMAVVVGSDGLYGGTYKAKYLAIEGAAESDTQQENLTVGMNVVKFIRTTYAPMNTMKDVTEDKLFFKNSSNSIWYGAKYDTTNAENPILRIQVIDNGIVKQIGYYDYTQSKWNQEIDEDIVLSEVCVISEVNLENLTMMNNEFTYGVIQDAEREIQWVELAAPGTITSTEYSEALETSKDILGVNENIE